MSTPLVERKKRTPIKVVASPEPDMTAMYLEPVPAPPTPAILQQPFIMEMVQFIGTLTRYGLGRTQISEILGISTKQLDWAIGRSAELKNVLEDSRRIADMAVVNALFSRAVGYNYMEVIYDKGGKEVKKMFKHLPPDVTACIFWLKNRVRDEWSDTYKTELTLRDRMELGYRQAQGEDQSA